MQYTTKQITLKNGKIAIFRAPAVTDAAAMLEHLRITAEETYFLSAYPEERTATVEDEERWISGQLDSTLTWLIVCEIDGEIAGTCALNRYKWLKMRHRGTVGIALKQKFWNLGIGTALFEEIIRIARERGLTQLELEFIEGNDRGRHLYEKMGFAVVAEKPNAIRLKDGTMLKEFFMIKEL